MPYKPKLPCRFVGCHRLTNQGYCEEHRKTIHNRYNKYQRDPNCNKRYGYVWKQIRKEFLKLHPLCEICKRNGKLTLTQEVHHHVALDSGGTHDFSNLQALCKACHSKVSADSGQRWHNRHKVKFY
ncbi:MAG: HNH endonuclease [Oscillospiraceae bacterium]|nr:HNH endonuclease [Oscillospiraceae bacterium]